MRIRILVALLPCALLAQTSPPRSANQDVFNQLQQRLDWFEGSAQPAQGAWKAGPSGTPRVTLPPVSIAVRSAALPGSVLTADLSPRVCAIPLLRARLGKPFKDRMPMKTAPGESVDPQFALPTPPVCEAWKP